jgi:hypothetical protein
LNLTKAAARYEAGVLIVRVPKAETPKPRQTTMQKRVRGKHHHDAGAGNRDQGKTASARSSRPGRGVT